MRILISIILIYIAGCTSAESRPNKDTPTIQPLDDVKPIKTYYCQAITDDLFAPHRCDKITFKSLYVAFCGQGSIAGHEEAGKLYRWDLATDQPCYESGQDLGSRSECSGDGYISASHVWISQADKAAAERSVGFLEDNDWRCGEGYSGYTNVKKLKWLLSTVRDWLYGEEAPTPVKIAAVMAAAGITGIGDLTPEFNKYLIALHAYAFGRMRHAFSDQTVAILRDLTKSSPDSMIFQSLYHRYLDGDQAFAIDLITRDCPPDSLPTDTGYAGWGSSPRAIHCIVAISILEGL